MDLTINRILKIFTLSIITALIPFCILFYIWGGYHNISITIIAIVLMVNTLPCIAINILYHKYYNIREWLSSFYFFITFFLAFIVIIVNGIRLLNGNYFDYLVGFIILFMLAESISVFIYITYIFIKYIKEKYDFSIQEKIIYLFTGFIFANFIIVFSAITSGCIVYIFD